MYPVKTTCYTRSAAGGKFIRGIIRKSTVHTGTVPELRTHCLTDQFVSTRELFSGSGSSTQCHNVLPVCATIRGSPWSILVNLSEEVPHSVNSRLLVVGTAGYKLSWVGTSKKPETDSRGPGAGGMMNETSKVEEIAVQRLSDYCEFVLGSLSRVDQRRLGEIYIRGLLTVEGRRSIKQIAAEIGGSSDQSLQQFVNQSPWDPQPVRQRVAEVMADVLKPEAWILDEIAFTKHGQHSAATERQFVPSRGRVANCQLGRRRTAGVPARERAGQLAAGDPAIVGRGHAPALARTHPVRPASSAVLVLPGRDARRHAR